MIHRYIIRAESPKDGKTEVLAEGEADTIEGAALAARTFRSDLAPTEVITTIYDTELERLVLSGWVDPLVELR
jgi:hypothetical protein